MIDRTELIVELSAILTSTLDYKSSLKRLASLIVPNIADGCKMLIIKDNGEYENVAQFPGWIDEITDHLTIHIPGRNLPLGSIVAVKMDRAFEKDEVLLLEEIGRRAGVAIENSLLYDAAQHAIHARDEFLSIASHELKTPITALKLQLQMTKRRIDPVKNLAPSPEQLLKFLDAAMTQVNRLTYFIEDLLDVSRIQSGKLDYHFEITDVNALITDVVERYMGTLDTTGCQVSLEIQDGIRARWDRLRIEQVLVNLITNVIKYAPKSVLKISADADDKSVNITFSDNGPGISIERQEKIFERFERATSSRNISGLGLGLYIVKEIINGHHGSIRLESREGAGTKFVIRLPREPRAGSK